MKINPWIALGLAAALLLACAPAYSMNHGFDPFNPSVRWFESLMRPDMGPPPQSCCGKADAYPVDRYERLPNGDFRIWIADGSDITFPDGKKRPPWNESIPIIVPSNKVNKEDDDLENPTDHSWVFMRTVTSENTDDVTIYCFVRHPNGV